MQQCAAKSGGAALNGPSQGAVVSEGFQQHETNEALQVAICSVKFVRTVDDILAKLKYLSRDFACSHCEI